MRKLLLIFSLPAILMSSLSFAEIQPGELLNAKTDYYGKITVAVFEAESSSYLQHHNDFTVTVPSDFVAIGGGIEGSENPGNLLTASYPNSNLSGWSVSSKDHLRRDPTKIKAYAIGIKVHGLSRSALLNYIDINTRRSSTGSHPSTSVGVPSGYQLIGGGFDVHWSGEGNLATSSYPANSYSWSVSSKDHKKSSPASITAFAVGIKNYIPGIGNIYVSTGTAGSSYAQHPSTTANTPWGYALVGCGAKVNWSGVGNLLWKIKPTTTATYYGCEVASKDHVTYSPATIDAYAIGILAI
jgi:hypothetical protein